MTGMMMIGMMTIEIKKDSAAKSRHCIFDCQIILRRGSREVHLLQLQIR